MSETPIEPELQLSAQPSSQPEHQAKPGWINHRRLLLLFLGFYLSAVILGLILYIQQRTRSKTNNQAGTVASCLSPECQWASARLSMSVDPFKHPCDYFLLTCGSDRPSSATGDTQKVKGSLGHRQRKKKRAVRPQRRTVDRKTPLLEYLREILESNGSLTSSAVKKAKGFYRSCLDTRSIETAGVEPFLALIQKVGGWEVSGKWNQTDFNSTLSQIMRDYATFPFFNLFVGKDPTEITSGANKKYIQIDQPDLLIPIEWNRKTQKSQAKTQTLRLFLASCQRYLALLGGPPATSMVHVSLFISLSSRLAVAAAPLHHRLSVGRLNQRMTIKELQEQAPAINWLHCLQAAFHPQPISQQDHVLLHNMPYIVKMSQIVGKWLNKHELSSRGPLQTYMVFNLLHTLMPALDTRFSETASNLSVGLGNTDEVVPRWKRCVLETERGFDSVLTHLLSERMAHREAEEMIHNIFSSLKSKLLELKLTDQTTYQFIVTKVESLLPRLWTSTKISGEAELDLLFSEVALSNHSFFSNYIQLLSLWQKRRSKLLDPQTDGVDILSVTPFLRDEELLFPMGMFVPPLFHPTYPRAMNYGALGFLIARDVLRLLLSDILSDSVRDVGQCVWSHYVTATEKAGGGGISLSAAQQQEVWVQYSALQIALQAYLQSLGKHPDDTSVSGFSHTRLFLRSFSQVNCDSDPHRDLMPLEPSFLITVICAKSGLCPSSLNCPNRTRAHSSPAC
ncbi:kell blood group glycoprotein [Genypterus blacodes]|uniref:kell blood group glycoprotein n=1 Tax=Genypterus blacodes TaxID=154954 RepID=UPI003F75D6D7